MSTLNIEAGIKVLLDSNKFTYTGEEAEHVIDQIIKALNEPIILKTKFLPVTEFMIKHKFGLLGMDYENHPETRFETVKQFLMKMVEEHHENQVIYGELTHFVSTLETADLTAEEYECLLNIVRGYY